MTVLDNISLKPFNTFGVEAFARHYVNITSTKELLKILQVKQFPEKFILGGGSNMLLTQNIDALVIHINNKGKQVIKEGNNHVYVKIEAGENWHEFVLWCIDNGYGGIENLSLIPGNVGTAPIQNIGAYGIELKDVFIKCETININNLTTNSFNKEDCNFGYRNSIFKQEEKGKHIITNVTLKLTKSNHKFNTSYGAIISKLEEDNITTPTIKDISNAVINIRQKKLPDPKKIGNSGSFFKNPVISTNHFKQLKDNFPDIPSYELSKNKTKIPAGWLIEKAGFKGKRFGDYGVHQKQALVLVNYGSANGSDILKLSKLIQHTVKRIFNVTLETEVNVF